MIQTKHLTLKRMSQQDLESALNLLTNNTVKKTYMLPAFENREDAIPLFHRLLELGEKRYIRGIYLNDNLIGYANEVEAIEKSIELGYLIHPDHHGKGYMTEALTALIPDLFALGYQSAAVGYCFGENSDHMPTPDIPDIATRDAMAESGEEIICKMVERMNMPHVVEQLRKLEAYGLENEQKYPWMPAAWNRNH